jgi:hypothetical protein
MKSLAFAILVATCLFLPLPAPAEDVTATRQFYEIRLYRLTSEEAAKTFDAMMEKGVMPALKRAGIGPVGVFAPKERLPEDADAVLRFLLIPHDGLSELTELKEKLAADPELWKHAEAYLSAPKDQPIYTRIESTLLQAFSGMPELKMPGEPADPDHRFFELRTYESPDELKGVLKVEMFDSAEIDIFDKVGLHPVFFGQALVAANLPQLTYMLVYENEADHKTAWDAFRASPLWTALKDNPKYADTVSKIHSRFLVATPYSAIR